MMTYREAKLRCQANRCTLKRTVDGEVRVTHTMWRKDHEARSYYTDDLEDAALTSAALDAWVRKNDDHR